jgi:endonuclease/exonuclease/phosphatase family metal-dependent hydrolase
MSSVCRLSRIPRRARVAVAVFALATTLGAGNLTGAARAETPGSAPAAGSGAVTVLTFNMCGEDCNADSTTDDITHLLAKVDNNHPAAVMLQEVCHDQFDALLSQSQESGHWALYGVVDTTGKRGCDGGSDRLGDAVLTHTPPRAGSVHIKRLKYAHGHGRRHQVRRTLCLRSVDAFPRTVEVCTVHIGLAFQIGAHHQATQIKESYGFARGQAPKIPLVYGGDFNVTPTSDALDRVYFTGGGGAHGAMEEADQCSGKHARAGRTKNCNSFTHDPTKHVRHRAKHDYVFVSRKSFRQISAAPRKSTYSDHAALVASMFLCSAGTC